MYVLRDDFAAAWRHARLAEANGVSRVVEMLKPDNTAGHAHDAAPQRDSLAGLHGNAAMEVLARRLNHIEHAAQKVARLAARPVIEDI
jgi:hypothetical protein